MLLLSGCDQSSVASCTAVKNPTTMDGVLFTKIRVGISNCTEDRKLSLVLTVLLFS